MDMPAILYILIGLLVVDLLLCMVFYVGTRRY